MSASFFGTYVGPSFQSSNYSDELKAQGLGQPNSLKRLYDFDGSGGGPLVHDKLWFFTGARWQTNENYLAGLYYNLNAGDPTKWTYAPDLTRQAYAATTQSAFNLRLTWQATPRNKFSAYGEGQPRRNGSGTSTNSPEAASDFLYPKNRVLVAGWTSTISSRLLLEAHFADHSEILYNVTPPDGTAYRPAGDIWKSLIPVLEQSNGLLYHGGGIAQGPNFLYSRQEGPNLYMTDVTMSYVTGAHAFKVGFNNLMGNNRNSNSTGDTATSYRFNNAVPNLITEYATPNSRRSHLTEGALFAQDKWTVKQLTINAGLRFDYFNTYFPEQFLGPGPLVPNRNITFEATDWYQWKDISLRGGAAYDLFGDGKTAVKVSIGKYVLAVDPTAGNPYFNLANVVTRSWDDRGGRGINGDYIPQCNLLNPQTNGECGTISDLRFGGLLPSTTTDPDTLNGWGKRPGNWEFSTNVQHELAPRVSLNCRLLPPLVLQLHGHPEPRRRADRLQPVQRRGALGSAPARRRQLHGRRPVRPEPEQGRPGQQPRHLRGQPRRADRKLQRIRHQREHASAVGRHSPGRDQHRQDDDRQLRHRHAVSQFGHRARIDRRRPEHGHVPPRDAVPDAGEIPRHV